jgi:hypothetical protein
MITTYQTQFTKVLGRLLAFTAVIAFTFLAPTAAHAAKKERNQPKDNGVKGSIAALDKDAKTIKVGSKVIIADSTTIITRSSKPINFEDLKVGEEVEISTFTLGDKLTAVSVRAGSQAAAQTPAPSEKSTEKPRKKKNS